MSKNIPFFKYQGTGNDFIIVDQFRRRWLSIGDERKIRWLCDRRFGIGADGLILIEPSEEHTFTMLYFNADGKEGSLCGNGSRCAVAFNHFKGRFSDHCTFEAADGVHEAIRVEDGNIELKMQPVLSIELGNGFYILDTGSPHYVTFVEDLSDLDIYQSGRAIRYSQRFREEGINVNFVEECANRIEVSTYERGVENETLSCGTGVTASALAHAVKHKKKQGETEVLTKGGLLKIRYQRDKSGFFDIWLCGPAKQVFQGKIEIPTDLR